MKNKPLKPGDILVSTEKYFENHLEHAVWTVENIRLEWFDAVLEWSSREEEKFDENNSRETEFQSGYLLSFLIEDYERYFVNIS